MPVKAQTGKSMVGSWQRQSQERLLEGAADATKFIEGRLEPSSSIVVQTGDPESPVNEERLLVALAREGDFYLVQQESPAPKAPLVY